MRAKTYVMVWNSVYNNLDSILSQIDNYEIINSDAPEKEGWHNLGMIWYYNQMKFALNHFVNNTDDDIFVWLAADAKSDKFKDVYSNALELLKPDDNCIYAPHLTHEAWTKDNVFLSEYGIPGVHYATQTDGVFVFIKRELAIIMSNFMEYLGSKENLVSMRSGWGIDYVWSSLAMLLGKNIIRDSRIIVFHPEGSSYDHGKAGSEMHSVFSRSYEFAEKNGIGGDSMKNMIDKISARMSNHNLGYHNFYKVDMNIPYMIVSIDEKRKSNKDRIEDMLGTDNRVFLDSLNAKDFNQLKDFMDGNPKFHLSWPNFKLGEIGCFGSHYLAWKWLVESGEDMLMVLEDDAYLNDDFVSSVKSYIDNVPDDYDVLSVYVDQNQHDNYVTSDHINDVISKSYQDWSTLCYIVSRSGAQRMIDFVHEVGMNEPVDWFIFRNSRRGNFNVYTPKPYMKKPLYINEIISSTVQGTQFFNKDEFDIRCRMHNLIEKRGNSEYSQINQDLFVLSTLEDKRGGFFVEFGACDGKYLSNTLMLENEYGWNGILAEPSPYYFEQLSVNRNCNLESLCVADETGRTMSFTEVDLNNDRGLSGLTNYAIYDHHTQTRTENSVKYDVETISLKDMLDKHNAPEIIDYLSIDTEGSEFLILNAYDFSRHFRVITVEHNNTENREKIYSLLSNNGYVRVLTELSQWDDWYIKKDLL